ncbi:MAG: TlpA family protein disulfide reductase [Candidatus Kerfeldbacteria bacterium]|nr:TlpA family protein disulfide reductase [Candidatus Kerfeldbacteria bacterium]
MKKFITIAGICCALPFIIIGFIFFYRGGSTSRSANANQPGNQSVNTPAHNAFPEFSVTDIDGQKISNGTLKGKPAIIWFTATWCTPCQIGAEAVAKLQDELGPQSFNVLVIFVDPKEQPSDLRRWREQFARPSWRLALNNGLAASSKIKFLDSKYLLNGDGTVRDFNTQIVDEQYLKLVRSIVG